MRNTEYCIVDTSTIAGLRKAERLHAAGWKVYFTGLFILRMSRTVSK
jgi:hypothetical protein